MSFGIVSSSAAPYSLAVRTFTINGNERMIDLQYDYSLSDMSIKTTHNNQQAQRMKLRSENSANLTRLVPNMLLASVVGSSNSETRGKSA